MQPLLLGADLAAELARRMLLVYTGASRFSGATIGRVMSGHERGDRTICAAFDGIRDVAERMPAALCAADFARVGELLSANWRLQQSLDPAMRGAIVRVYRSRESTTNRVITVSPSGCPSFVPVTFTQ